MTEEMEQITSPLTITLAKINAYSEHFMLHLGMPDELGWRRAGDIVNDEAWLGAHLTQLHAQQSYLPKHAVATNFYDGYQWYLVTAGAAGFLLDGRVPNLDVDNIAFKFDDEGWVRGIALLSDAFVCLPADEAAGLPGVAVLEDREALRCHFAGQVWAHVGQLIPPIQSFMPTSEHVLRVATANSLAGTVLWMLQAVKQHAIAEEESRATATALPFPTRPRYFAVACNGERELYLDGSVCCYWYLRPDNNAGRHCANCPHIPLPRRIEVLRESMLARQRSAAEAQARNENDAAI